jgi:hypothetical protein
MRQNAYAKFGFIKASKADLAVKEIPQPCAAMLACQA